MSPTAKSSAPRPRSVRMRVRMEAEFPAAPADEEAEGEVDDDEPDRRLRRLLNPLRKEAVEDEDGSPKANSVAMAETPGKPELPGPATARSSRPLATSVVAANEVVGIGRVAES